MAGSEARPVQIVAPPTQQRLRVALVRPPIVVNPRNLGYLAPVPPLGLAYLAASVRAGGHEVQLIDSAGLALDQATEFATGVGPMRRIGLTPEQAVERIDPATQVIGVNLMFLHEWYQSLEIVRRARARFPDVPIVMGGETVTACWPRLLDELEEVDHLVLGEGERTFHAVLGALASGDAVPELDGLVSRRAPADSPGLPRRVRHLEELPRPAWDLVPLDRYFAYHPHGVNRGRSMPMLASRGCPYKCTFCSSPQMWTTRYAVRDPDDLADEIATYVDRYGIRNVNFHDLTAITKRQWTLDFCDALDRHGVRVTWQLPVGTRSEALDAEVLRRLHDTGCRNLTYAPESGAPNVLAAMDKRVDLEHVLASVREARKVGISPAMNVIIGHPSETRRDLLQTYRYVLRAALAGCDDVSPIRFAPYPGSADWDEIHARGEIDLDDATIYGGINRAGASAPSWSPHTTARQLKAAQAVFILSFYAVCVLRRPGRMWRIWRARRTGQEETHLDELLRGRRDMRRQQAA